MCKTTLRLSERLLTTSLTFSRVLSGANHAPSPDSISTPPLFMIQDRLMGSPYMLLLPSDRKCPPSSQDAETLAVS